MSDTGKRRKAKPSKGSTGKSKSKGTRKRKKPADLLVDPPSGEVEDASGVENSGASGEDEALGSEAPGSESELKQAAPEKSLKDLLRELRKGDAKARARAAKELGGLGEGARKAVPYLAKALDDDEEDVRYRSARALGQIGAAADRGIPALIRTLGKGSKDRSRDAKSVQGAAAKALKKIGSPALPHLFNALETDALRRQAGRLLGRIAPTANKAERAALRELLELESRRAAIAAVDALESHGTKSVHLLLICAADGHEEVGRRAMRALRKIGESAVTSLAKALGSKQAGVRACAAASLGDIANRVSQRAVSRTIERLSEAVGDTDPSVRAASIGALSNLTDYEERVLPGLITAIGDAEASVSLSAVMGVLKVGTDREEITEHMIDVLEGRASTYTRVGACMVLMHLGTDAKAAVETLVDALEDEAAEVREYAHLALNAIRTPSMRLNVIRTASMRLKVAEPDAKKSRPRGKTKLSPKRSGGASKKRKKRPKGTVPRARRTRRR